MLNKLISQSKKSREEGFTLIELLVAILIIGVLVSFALPIFLNQQKQAHITMLKSDIRNTMTETQTWLAAKKPVLTNMQTIALNRSGSGFPPSQIPTGNDYKVGTTGAGGINVISSDPKITMIVEVHAVGASPSSGARSGLYKVAVYGQNWNISGDTMRFEVNENGSRWIYSGIYQ